MTNKRKNPASHAQILIPSQYLSFSRLLHQSLVKSQIPGIPFQTPTKTMMFNRKQPTVTCNMLTAVARDRRWPDVVTGSLACFSKFAFVFFCFITNHLMTGPLVNFVSLKSQILFPSTSSRGNREILGKQNSLFPSGPVIKF